MYSLILAEDDFHIRTGLSDFFPWESLGFHLVGSFQDGAEALAFFKAHPVDVVLTDIKMPAVDGLALAREIRRLSSNATIIFISAYRNFEYARQAMELGVKRYLIKSAKYDEMMRFFQMLRKELDQEPLTCNPSSGAGLTSTENPVIRKVLQQINDHTDKASLQYIADSVSMNPIYLSRYFKEQTGVNFSEYLFKKRMELAGYYLSRTTLSITEISEKVGYSNDKNFSKAFKKYFSIPPSQYRRQS